MVALPHKRWTAEDYLAFERASDERHEFIDGQVYLMAGASENHNLITANVIIALGSQLRGRPCKLYPSDMRVRVSGRDDYHYPDISVVCGEAQIEDDEQDTLLNPTLIVEVLSPSTEQFDRGKKFENYRLLPSLQEYVLIAQDHAHIEHYVRQEGGAWLYSEVKGLDALNEVSLPSIGCSLSMADVYDKVEFGSSKP